MSAVRKGKTVTDRYLRSRQMTRHDLTVEVGCSDSAISRTMNGQRNVGLDFAKRIEAATNGEVTALQFLADCLPARIKHKSELAQ